MERRDRFASVHGRILARSVPLVLGYFPASLPGLDRPYAIVALSQKATLEVDRFARQKCPLLEIAAIALQPGHVAMGQERA